MHEPDLAERHAGPTFQDQLYDWTERSPYLALAAAVHVLLFLILNAIPWQLLQEPEVTELVTAIEVPPEEPFEEPIEPPEPIPIPDVVPIDPDVVTTADVEAPTESDSEDDLEPSDFEPAYIGLGPGNPPGGPPGRGPHGGDRGGDGGYPEAVSAALEWLADHQAPSGGWDCDCFAVECSKPGPLADGEGDPLHDVGVTGLALLAFLGAGNSLDGGPYADTVRRGVDWLSRQQDPDTGLVGDDVGEHFLYRHAIATLALCEAYYGRRNPLLKRRCEAALRYAERARNSYSGWRYTAPGNSQSDTSVTGWMVFALAAGEDAGLAVDREALYGALSWLDEATDPATGRTGYDTRGGASSRSRANQHYPFETGEAMTAVALLSRVFAADALGEELELDDTLERGADLLLERPPLPAEGGLGGDLYYWYYGTYALYQIGGKRWQRWERSLVGALLPAQRTSPPCLDGSWDPDGPWGYSGGRVYSTALGALCLQVHHRYGRLLGAR